MNQNIEFGKNTPAELDSIPSVELKRHLGY
jgi:hypothetical protein